MSNTTPRRGGGATPSGGASGRRAPATSGPSPTPGARASPSANVLSSNGVGGTPSGKATPVAGRPARPSNRRAAGNATSANNAEDEAKAEEARAESAALIESLRQSLKESEASAEDYKRQASNAQQRLDELNTEHSKMEEDYHTNSERVQELEFEQRESKRHAQEMERIYDNERSAMEREREESAGREKELKATVQRLKESIAEREFRASSGAAAVSDTTPKGSPSEEHSDFAPPAVPRKDSQSGGSRTLVQKDQIIESLRLELADAQIKLIEMDNTGGDRVQQLEKSLLETRMENARLQEDNESFQILLGERTISGDFQKGELMQGVGAMTPSGLGSLAEELESAEGEGRDSRRLETELKSMKDQNKALTLYIEKIISRVLQHDNFETILDHKGGLGAMPKIGAGTGTDKELPPPPPAKDERPTSNDGASAGGASGFLQRATSVVKRQRPVSTIFTSAPSGLAADDATTLTSRTRPGSGGAGEMPRLPTANENPRTAPSIPLGRATSVSVRGGRGPASGGGGPGARMSMTSTTSAATSATSPASPERGADMPGAAGIVSQMYKPSAGSPGAAPLSPLLSPGGTHTRGAYFGAAAASSAAAAGRRSSASGSATSGGDAATGAGAGAGSTLGPTSATSPSQPGHERAGSIASDAGSGTGRPESIDGGGGSGTPSAQASPQRDRHGAGAGAGAGAGPQYTGAVMQQNRLRPLRLIGDEGNAASAAAARKKANRSSWMGWIKGEGGGGPAAWGLGGGGGGGGGSAGGGLDRTEEERS